MKIFWSAGHEKVTQLLCKGMWFKRAKLLPVQILLSPTALLTGQSYQLTITESSLGEQCLSTRVKKL